VHGNCANIPARIKEKGKGKVSLCFTKHHTLRTISRLNNHHAMKECRRVGL